MTRTILVVLFSLSIIPPALGQSTAQTDNTHPSDAVFQISIYEREPDSKGNWHGLFSGTGFFTSPDGIALTASHVVYRVVHDPKKYRLIAVIGKEFYDAEVICASKLPYDPTVKDTNQVGVPYTRDVAEIKVSPTTAFEGRKDTLYWLIQKTGERIEMAKAHTGPMPVLTSLTLGGIVADGTHVRVIGYGAISALPYKWTSEGKVDSGYSGRDGTPLFDVTSSNPARPGDSGSPVLDDQNQVVGLWAWHYYSKPATGTAQRSSAFEKPCQ